MRDPLAPFDNPNHRHTDFQPLRNLALKQTTLRELTNRLDVKRRDLRRRPAMSAAH
jgi:hypothetical protein